MDVKNLDFLTPTPCSCIWFNWCHRNAIRLWENVIASDCGDFGFSRWDHSGNSVDVDANLIKNHLYEAKGKMSSKASKRRLKQGKGGKGRGEGKNFSESSFLSLQSVYIMRVRTAAIVTVTALNNLEYQVITYVIPVSVVTWVSLRKFFGENKIKILKIFLNLDNYQQKDVKVEALWRTFFKTLLKSYNQKLQPTRKDQPIFLRSYGLAIKRTRSLWKNRIKSISLSLLLLLFQVPVSLHLVHATILVWSFCQPFIK